MFIPQWPSTGAEMVISAAYLIGMGGQYACDVLLIKKARLKAAVKSDPSEHRTWLIAVLAYATAVVALGVGLIALCYIGRLAHYHNFAVATSLVAAQQLVGFTITAVFVWRGVRQSQKE